MRAIVLLPTLFALTTIVPPVAAVTVVQCRDQDGTLSFRERCPAGSEQVGARKIAGVARADNAAEMAEVVRKSPITLYIAANCDACDLVRQQLTRHKLPFTEHNVEVDAGQQAALKAATGTLTVPAVTIGKEVFTGYSRAALETGLKAAGYPLAPEASAP